MNLHSRESQHFSPRHISALLAEMDWSARHVLLKRWFACELLEAADNPGLRQRDWWVQQAYARCPDCQVHKWRIEIGGHWRSPFYLCPSCGTVESFYDLVR